VNRLFGPLEPAGVVTTTLTFPADPDGVTQVAFVALVTLKLEQALPPTVIAVAPVKFAPEITIDVPPAVEPEFGVTEETVGGARYVNKLFCTLVPDGVVTTTLADPADLGGVTQVAFVALVTVTFEQGLPPTVIAVAPVRFAPEITIDVPPAVEPKFGDTPITVGKGLKVVNVETGL
jgi:hypothetical protein